MARPTQPEPMTNRHLERLELLYRIVRRGEEISSNDVRWLVEYAVPIVFVARGLLGDVQRWSDPSYSRRRQLEQALSGQLQPRGTGGGNGKTTWGKATSQK